MDSDEETPGTIAVPNMGGEGWGGDDDTHSEEDAEEDKDWAHIQGRLDDDGNTSAPQSPVNEMAFAFGSDFDELVSNTITASHLMELTGFDDLTEAQQLSLTNIDTGKTPIDHLGELLPNLVKLR